jgi:transcriptional regulator with XRE-family HTH domain
MNAVRDIVRDARRNSGLTQAQLANAAGTTQSAIARLETPGANPRLETLERVLRAMGYTLEIDAGLPEVDERQILDYLRLTPAERLARFEHERNSLRDLLGATRWQTR